MFMFFGFALALLVLEVVCGPAGPPEPVPLAVEVPLQGVYIGDELIVPVMKANIDYLLTSFDVNHMLQPFRIRAGKHAPPGNRAPIRFWDTDLAGSNAGRFLMGAGNTLRWINDTRLRAMLDEIIDGIEECRNATTGYILAFPPEGFMHSEQGDYGRSWFTQGLIEAGKCGNQKVWPLLRGQYDWFNDPEQNPYLPYLYDSISNGEQGEIASTRMYLETPVGVYADVQVAQDTYRDDYWMRQLIARDPVGISDYHMPAPHRAHCYEITSFLAMFDNYRATGNSTYLEAARGAWELIHDNFVNVDGSSALKEGSPNYPAKTYRISSSAATGETCCTMFWIKFNQRFHLLTPEEERYAAQIETAIYNALLRQMAFRPSTQPPWVSTTSKSLPPGIRYHAPLQGTIEKPNNDNTCCEGQGTRAFGSLPEYIYSLAPDGFYINMFAASTLEFNASVSSSPSGAQHGNLPKLISARSSDMSPSAPNPPMSWMQIETDGWRTGAYCQGTSTKLAGTPPPCPQNVTTLEDCKSLCLASKQPTVCMGLTWLRDAPITALNRCTLYRAIDLTARPRLTKGCEQWLVVGRRQNVQIDYPVNASLARGWASDSSGESHEFTKINFGMTTNFPFGNDVAMHVSWATAHVSSVSMKVRVRIPSWLSAPLNVYVNGQLHSHGSPGSYLPIDRQWRQDDKISISLPTVYRLSLYTGVEQVAGYEGKRYALLVGPIVLACVGPLSSSFTTVLPLKPANPDEWLIPSNVSLHFFIKGVDGFKFKPLWDVLPGENFTAYPIYGEGLSPSSDILL